MMRNLSSAKGIYEASTHHTTSFKPTAGYTAPVYGSMGNSNVAQEKALVAKKLATEQAKSGKAIDPNAKNAQLSAAQFEAVVTPAVQLRRIRPDSVPAPRTDAYHPTAVERYIAPAFYPPAFLFFLLQACLRASYSH